MEKEKIPVPVRWHLLLLCAISTVNFVDRQILGILIEPIKNELHLSDTELGILGGIAFAFFYSTLSLPAARLAEYLHRPRLLGGAIALWSSFTALCGLALNFWMLVAARVGVAVGESAATPTAQSLISDYVSRTKRASAMAFYGMGAPLGAMFGMAIGGIMVDAFSWRAAFFVVGAPGLLLAILAATLLPEPRLTRGAPKPIPPLLAVLKSLLKKKSAICLMIGAMTMSAINYGLFSFVAPLFTRVHGPEIEALATGPLAFLGLGKTGLLGLSLGLSAGITGVLGAILGGRLADRLAAKDVTWNLYLPMISVSLSVPVYFTMALSNSAVTAVCILALHTFIMATTLAPGIVNFLGLVPQESRATAASLDMIAVGLIGLGLGPVLIGVISDLYNHSGLGSAEGLRYSLLTIKSLAFFYLVVMFIASRYYRKEFVS